MKMNKKQYNNIIEHSLQYDCKETDNSLDTARIVFNNMGVALPQGTQKEVYDTISTNEYMGWRKCTLEEAKEAANNGTAAIGISEDKIVILSAEDEEQRAPQTASVLTLTDNTPAISVANLQYYAYSYNKTKYGCGGVYRQVNDYYTNCLEYALLLDTDADIGLMMHFYDPQLNSSSFIGRIISTIESNTYFTCRSINSYNSEINSNEYRIAARVPHKDGYNYHFIYQLSDGTWAGKDDTSHSRHFGNKNPSLSPEMWANDAYSPEAGTIYFAVKRF